MFPQRVVHRDGSSPLLRRTEAVAPGGSGPGRFAGDGVLQTEGPLVRRGRPRDDSLLPQLPHHVLHTDQATPLPPAPPPYYVPGRLGRRVRVDDDRPDLLDEMPVVETVQPDTGLRKCINSIKDMRIL